MKHPLNILADKGTNCHRTRQFTMVVVVVPDSPQLLTPIYLGQPVVKQHDGAGIAQSIVSELNTWEISASQVGGGLLTVNTFTLMCYII